MNILIIGNGFDIAHGLPTSYLEFLDMCVALNKYNIHNISTECVVLKDDKGIGSKRTNDFYKTIGYKTLDDFISLVSSNYWVGHFKQQKRLIGEKWIDFENEIMNKMLKIQELRAKDGNSDTIDTAVYPDERIRGLCKKISKDRVISYKDLYNKILADLKDLIIAMKYYYFWVSSTCNCQKNEYISSKTFDGILSFNYTSIYSQVYSKDVDCCFIHGSVGEDIDERDCNMVLGFDDAFIEENIASEIIPFEKYYQRIVNRNDNQYFRWLEQMEKSYVNNVYIFGHSLGATDGDVLKKFIECNNTKVYIYYLDEVDRANKIRNLAVILGRDKLIELTCGENPSIVFETDDA